nr:hypothetical protein KitaXyl93_76370 [Kitasatospora sp. Xyl93]
MFHTITPTGSQLAEEPPAPQPTEALALLHPDKNTPEDEKRAIKVFLHRDDVYVPGRPRPPVPLRRPLVRRPRRRPRTVARPRHRPPAPLAHRPPLEEGRVPTDISQSVGSDHGGHGPEADPKRIRWWREAGGAR